MGTCCLLMRHSTEGSAFWAASDPEPNPDPRGPLSTDRAQPIGESQGMFWLLSYWQVMLAQTGLLSSPHF